MERQVLEDLCTLIENEGSAQDMVNLVFKSTEGERACIRSSEHSLYNQFILDYQEMYKSHVADMDTHMNIADSYRIHFGVGDAFASVGSAAVFGVGAFVAGAITMGLEFATYTSVTSAALGFYLPLNDKIKSLRLRGNSLKEAKQIEDDFVQEKENMIESYLNGDPISSQSAEQDCRQYKLQIVPSAL